MEHPERIVRCQLWVQLCDAALDRRVPHAGGRGVRHNLHQPRVGASKDLRPPTAGLRDHLEAQLRYRTAVQQLRATGGCMVYGIRVWYAYRACHTPYPAAYGMAYGDTTLVPGTLINRNCEKCSLYENYGCLQPGQSQPIKVECSLCKIVWSSSTAESYGRARHASSSCKSFRMRESSRRVATASPPPPLCRHVLQRATWTGHRWRRRTV
jgi:hypothetical protein